MKEAITGTEFIKEMNKLDYEIYEGDEIHSAYMMVMLDLAKKIKSLEDEVALLKRKEFKTCESCKHLRFTTPSHDQPYTEIFCSVKQWEDIEFPEDLSKENDCDSWVAK